MDLLWSFAYTYILTHSFRWYPNKGICFASLGVGFVSGFYMSTLGKMDLAKLCGKTTQSTEYQWSMVPLYSVISMKNIYQRRQNYLKTQWE
jgi:hypothetical protein